MAMEVAEPLKHTSSRNRQVGPMRCCVELSESCGIFRYMTRRYVSEGGNVRAKDLKLRVKSFVRPAIDYERLAGALL